MIDKWLEKYPQYTADITDVRQLLLAKQAERREDEERDFYATQLSVRAMRNTKSLLKSSTERLKLGLKKRFRSRE